MDQASREVSVTGVGEVFASPDLVTFELGVSVMGETVAAASARAATAARALHDSLTASGVESGDVTTIGYSVNPEYDWSDNQRRLLGYRVVNTVRARIRDTERAADVLDAAMAAGGDSTQVNSVRFAIEDEGALLTAARDAAWDDASSRARQIAGLAGESLGPVLSVSESAPGTPGPLPVARLRMEAADATTPIESGSTSVTVTLHVRFALGDQPT